MTTKILSAIEEFESARAKAHDEICGLADGSRRWNMCIPVQQTDSDIVLQAPLDKATLFTQALKVAVAKLADIAWLDNPNELKYITSPTAEYMAKAREAIAEIESILTGGADA